MPLLRVASDEIVDGPWQTLLACNGGILRRAKEGHAQKARGRGMTSKSKIRLGLLEQGGKSPSMTKELCI